MKLVEAAIRYPVKVAVGAILVVLFGSLALARIPVQLIPTVEEPEISVLTVWPGASPQEVEREIIDEQEEQLQGLEGLVKLESSSSDSRGTITLTFQTGTQVDSALLKVSNRLQQVQRAPLNAEKPVVQTVSSGVTASAWFAVLPIEGSDYDGEIGQLLTFFVDFVKPQYERVEGVGSVNFFGGQKDELQVVVDATALAARQITIVELVDALDRENRNISGGDFDEGKRRYLVRTLGEYTTPEDVENVVVAFRNRVPVYVRDIARVVLAHEKAVAEVYLLGRKTIAFNAVRAVGSNVLAVMRGLRATTTRINQELLADRGLHVVQLYDETEYIDSAIDLVQQSLVVGSVLAILVLMVFLRSPSSTLIIAIAIPISVVGTFLMMAWFGRTLNVISLAGMAFAVGMVVDNSIVVLENIYRHRQMGKAPLRAASDGANEVWGAVLASTLTTIAVFVPILFVREEAGQLFRDIALAISCAVGLSLLVAITLIPTLAARLLRAELDESDHRVGGRWDPAPFARRFADWVVETVYWLCATTRRRLSIVLGLTVAAVVLSALLAPKAEYLPTGNQNSLFGIIQTPPGQSLAETAKLKDRYREELADLWTKPARETRDMPGGGVRSFWFVALANQAFMGISARVPERVRELLPEFNGISSKFPGSYAFVFQSSLFQRRFGAGRTIDIELTGPELSELVVRGGRVLGQVASTLPGAQARAVPSLDLANPEVHVVTDRRRAAELGISNRDLGTMIDVLVDGAKASEYRFQGREIDLRVIAKGAFSRQTHLLDQLPIATPAGELVTVGSIARVEMSTGPTQIAHRDRQRTITIQVTPPEEVPLQAAMEAIQDEILAPMTEEGRLGGLYRVQLTGSADKLTQTARALGFNFVLAVVITYLLMAALFESFLYPFVILFSVPLAALGGFLGLGVVNLFTLQPLDVLTMLGFIILVGTVVNNAILIVHQSLENLQSGESDPRRAIRDAVANRIRPIFMSVSTSVCGMLPLILFPGAGSELYRGLGSVVIGGLVVSTVFTLFLVPALFSLVLDARAAVALRFGTAKRKSSTFS